MVKALVSCSNHPEDFQLVNGFKHLFRTVGFSPVTIGQEVKVNDGEVVQTIIKEIKNSDCLILIGTPRYIMSDFKNKMAEAFHEETFMAYILNKPILAFVDSTVDVKGLIPYSDQSKLEVVRYEGNLNLGDPLTFNSILQYLSNLGNKVSFLKNEENRKKVAKVLLGVGVLGLVVYVGYQLGKNSKSLR